jgi:hypothetical protein
VPVIPLAVTAIFPIEREVHRHVEGPKGFAAFRRAPYDHDAGSRNDAFDQICGRGSEKQVAESNQLEPRRTCILAIEPFRVIAPATNAVRALRT